MLLRLIMGLIGAGFALVVLISLGTDLSTYFASPPEETAEHEFHRHPKELHLASDGPLGRFDKQQLQRGFQVYKEVCAACHGISLLSFRDLAALGYEEPEIKKIATDWLIEVPTVNQETGEAATRKAIASDRFPSPYPNELAARAANNNALPPDLSLIAKAREGGAAYIYSLLTGYQNPSPELLKKYPDAKPGEGLYHNPYFPNLNLAMPPPITSDGQVTYAEGNPAPTVDQMSKDVSAFLVWAAEPKADNRKNAGIPVLLFLLIASLLGYLAYREIWRTAKRKVRITGPLEPESQAKAAAARADAGIEG
jgi:ubiquinol-cytochrome c reductase cytochrome c1 subunit